MHATESTYTVNTLTTSLETRHWFTIRSTLSIFGFSFKVRFERLPEALSALGVVRSGVLITLAGGDLRAEGENTSLTISSTTVPNPVCVCGLLLVCVSVMMIIIIQ